ncbi:hypothetical protein BH11ARM1_BH11ARM1_08580 [soil metagenome]
MLTTASAQSVVNWGSYGYLTSAAQSNVTQIRAQGSGRIALKTDGSVVVWSMFGGSPSFGPASVQFGVTAVATSNHHQLAVKNGAVIAWGSDSGGGETVVPGYAMSGVTDVGASNYDSVALINGGVYVWGYNQDGIADVPVAAQSEITAISVAEDHILALTSTGGVVAWGTNYQGDTVVPLAAQSDVVQISANYTFNLALKSDGSVVAWGSDYSGESTVPAAALSHVVLIGTSSQLGYAFKDDGTIITWGVNVTDRLPPATVHDVTAMSGGSFGQYAIRPAFPAESLVAPNEILSGESGIATVTLASPAPVGGATVTLSSNDSLVHIPATVTVPEGETTATYTVSTDYTFGGNHNPRISTTYGGETQFTNFYVIARGAGLTSNRATVKAGSDQAMTMTLTIDSALPVPVTFTLSGDTGVDPPASVKIPAGKTSVSFKVYTNTDISTGSYYDEWDDMWYPYTNNVYARYAGTGPNFNFTAVPILASMTLTGSGYAGQYVSGLIKLDARPRATTSVGLTTDDANIPDFAVDVVAGASGAYFNMLLPLDAVAHTVHVTAALNGTTVTRAVNIKANPLISLSFTPNTVTGGTSTTGKVSVLYPVGVDTVVTLSSSLPGIVQVPTTVTIHAGSSSATYTVTTAVVHNQRAGRVTATLGSVILKANVTVTP